MGICYLAFSSQIHEIKVGTVQFVPIKFGEKIGLQELASLKTLQNAAMKVGS